MMEPVKSIERVLSQKAVHLGNSFPCQVCVIGFLSGICIASLFLFLLEGPNLHIAGFNNDVKCKVKEDDDPSVSQLFSTWSLLLEGEETQESPPFGQNPDPPHLENCKIKALMSKQHDQRHENSSLPPWKHLPPWVMGSDEDNYPLTRKVQSDIWKHQHPLNCKDESLRFLVTDWETSAGFGMGAQIAGMCGLLAIALNEKRILVSKWYNRADHEGSARGRWSCYFLPETSRECENRAFELMNDGEAVRRGIITTKRNYSSKEIWAGKIPRIWGEPWLHLPATTEVNGTLLLAHRKMDRRWWRAQGVRYLMRFETERTCGLMNKARHDAFGKEAAKMVIKKQEFKKGAAWIPRPMMSVHVRMGDKDCEMKVVGFEEYMKLAEKVRRAYPEVINVWLSTEMQEVVDKLGQYKRWRFYYTKVWRQEGNMTMATYEARLGRRTSTEYPLVNFLMATESDYFVGALGSTWCFLIDGMRNTGGKVAAGYFSVNKDRFW